MQDKPIQLYELDRPRNRYLANMVFHHSISQTKILKKWMHAPRHLSFLFCIFFARYGRPNDPPQRKVLHTSSNRKKGQVLMASVNEKRRSGQFRVSTPIARTHGIRTESHWCVTAGRPVLRGKGSLRANGARPGFRVERPALTPSWMAAQAPAEGGATSEEWTPISASRQQDGRQL